jgi:predicted permease
LGLGACTAIFGVAHAVLLRPLPYPLPDRLLTVWESNPEKGNRLSLVSPPTFLDVRQSAGAFSHVAAYGGNTFELTGLGYPQHVAAIAATPGIFSLLGVSMAVGSGFPREAEQPGGDAIVVLSYQFWRRWFGGDSDAIGRTLKLDGQDFRVVGVLPERFWFPAAADLWTPLAFGPAQITEGMRGARYLQTLARLKPGVSPEQARSEMTGLADHLGSAHPNNAGWGFQLESLHDHLVGDYRRLLVLLLGAVGFVLCIACANVVNLVMARANERRGEKLIRAALGATKLRLLRDALVENLLLALLGAAVAIAAAFWMVTPLVRLAPAAIPRLDQVAIDGWVIAFCLSLSLAVGLVLTLVARLSEPRDSDHAILRVSGARTAGHTGHRVRRLLIVGEVALSLVLLIGAGLMLRSFLRLHDVDPGFRTDGVMTASLSLPRARYASNEARVSFFRDLLAQTEILDGVVSVGATTNLPMAGSTMRFGFGIDGRADASLNERLAAEYHAASPGYFRTMGIALRGRSFVASDNSDGAPVVIINQSMARRFWPASDPVGERITVVSQDGPVSREIVGIVADVRHAGLASEPRLEVYVPLAQDPWPFVTVVARTVRGETLLTGQLRDQLLTLDQALPLSRVQPLERLVATWLAPLQFQLVLVGVFALVALLMAMLGMYGVISYVVSRRVNEIGIRMALGARQRDVLRNVAGEAIGLAGAGVVLGTAAAAVLTGSLASLLYEVSPTDPATFAAISLLVLAVASAACFVPAYQAARVDPICALRQE